MCLTLKAVMLLWAGNRHRSKWSSLRAASMVLTWQRTWAGVGQAVPSGHTLPVTQTSGRFTIQSANTSDSAAPIWASLPCCEDTSMCLHPGVQTVSVPLTGSFYGHLQKRAEVQDILARTAVTIHMPLLTCNHWPNFCGRVAQSSEIFTHTAHDERHLLQYCLNALSLV